jgi:hypothetical protein
LAYGWFRETLLEHAVLKEGTPEEACELGSSLDEEEL